jgi:hypothetical protein
MALDSDQEKAAVERAAKVREDWGHPDELWQALIGAVQDGAVRNFATVADEWLSYMWCLDQYRMADAPPIGMGDPEQPYGRRMDGIYRGKGNSFATLLSLLLENRTGQAIRSRSAIKGYSQNHQVDLAWPDRRVAPIVCAESKLTGGPPYRGQRPRGAMDDWTNRRKELKFSATDLKLSRRDQTESIGHWDVWRLSAMPKTFLLWGARLGPKDNPNRMVKEVAAVVSTYLDGAGVFAWAENGEGSGYKVSALPSMPTVETIDDALWRIESEIKKAVASGAVDEQPEPSAPLDPDRLAEDLEDEDSPPTPDES